MPASILTVSTCGYTSSSTDDTAMAILVSDSAAGGAYTCAGCAQPCSARSQAIAGAGACALVSAAFVMCAHTVPPAP